MPKYGGTLAEVIPSHVRPLPQKVQKEGVWEDTRMLKFALRGCASKTGLVGVNRAQIWWNFSRSNCKSRQAPSSKSSKRRGLGGYADAKLRFGGMRLRGRARGSQPCPNMVELCLNSLQVTSSPYLKKSKKKGFGRIRGC